VSEFVRKCLSQKPQRHKAGEIQKCDSPPKLGGEFLFKTDAIDDVLEGIVISVELVLRGDTDEVIDLAIG
jgi:hypothetical protein